MKNYRSFSNPLLALVLAGPVGADTIYSDFQNIAIPATLDGVYLNVETGAYGTTPVSGWDINPFFGGVGVANSATFQPARVSSTASLSTIQSFAAGSTISSSLIYSLANSTGGSQDHLGLSGTPYIAGQEGYLGFRLNDTGYGWMRVVFDGTGTTAAIKDWAYDSTGTIAVGNVIQSGSTYTLDSSTQSFTLGSAISGANSVIKTGANTVTLGTTNSYSAGTTISGGTLELTHNNAAGTGAISLTGATGVLKVGSGISLGNAANDITISNAGASVVRTVAASGAYSLGTGIDLKSDLTGGIDTIAKILDGTNAGTAEDLTMKFSASPTGTVDNDGARRSDVLTITNSGSFDAFVLQLTANNLAADSVLGRQNGNLWEWAVNGIAPGISAQQNYVGSFASLVGETYTLSNFLGSFGYDPNAGGTGVGGVWAVVNHGGSFTAVPEPTSALAGLLLTAGLLRRRRKC